MGFVLIILAGLVGPGLGVVFVLEGQGFLVLPSILTLLFFKFWVISIGTSLVVLVFFRSEGDNVLWCWWGSSFALLVEVVMKGSFGILVKEMLWFYFWSPVKMMGWFLWESVNLVLVLSVSQFFGNVSSSPSRDLSSPVYRTWRVFPLLGPRWWCWCLFA